jgi:hypothetical protein
MTMSEVTSGENAYIAMNFSQKNQIDEATYQNIPARKPEKVEYAEVTIENGVHYMPMGGTLKKKDKSNYANIRFD